MTVWCTKELAEDIEELRLEDDMSRAVFIRHAISEYIAWRKRSKLQDIDTSLLRQELTEEILAALAEEAAISNNSGKDADTAKKRPG